MFKTWTSHKLEEAKAPEEGAPAGGTPPPAAEASSVDEFGYAVEPSAAPAPPEEKKAAPVEPEAEVIKDPVSGYGEEPQPEVPPEPEAPPPPEPEVKLEYELEAKDLDAKEVTKIKELAAKHKLPKEAAQEILDQKLAETKAVAKAEAERKIAAEKAVQAIKSKWDSELRKDPTFGGDKFNKNVMAAEKVLAEFMPETKKALTERKSMLPPYVMRDLAQLAAKLYQPEKMIQGEPTIAEKKIESSEDAHLSFYT